MLPLDPVDLELTRAAVARTAPGWAGVEVATSAKYLGVYVDYGREENSWRAPLRKFLDRAQQWGRLGVGLQLSLNAYSVYMSFVLLFVGQLEELPSDWRDWEQRACTALLPGPRGWMQPSFLRRHELPNRIQGRGKYPLRRLEWSSGKRMARWTSKCGPSSWRP